MYEVIPLLVAVPLGAAFLLPIIGKLKKHDSISDIFSVIVSATILLMAILLLGGRENLVYWMGGWSAKAPSITGIAVYVDGLTRLLILVVAGVTFAVTIFSIPYMKRYTSKPLYWCLFFLMVAGMNGLVISADLFNMYVFLEIAAIASYGLVAFGCESEELEASFKYLIMSAVASTFILFGVGILYNITGTLNAAQVGRHIAEMGWNLPVLIAVSFFIIGYGLKAALVPLHAWLPDAHPSAPAPISAMLSGVIIKAVGVYALCRVVFNVFGLNAALAQVLIGAGILSMVVGVCMAVGQWDFKRLLAYHSISQMGYVILGIGVGAEMLVREGPTSVIAGLAIFGALFHLVNHALFKSLLFLCSGSIELRAGSRYLKELGGLSQRMPWTSGCCRIAALSISGIPPFNGFWSKLVIIVATVWAGHYLLGAVTVLVSFLTLVSFIKVQRYILDGPLPAKLSAVKESPGLMVLAMLILTVACLASGVLVPLYGPSIIEPARQALIGGVEGYVKSILGGLM